MACNTSECLNVEAVVKRWMDNHSDLNGLWNVFDVPDGLDIIVSVRQPDGVRRLTLTGQQGATSVAPQIERHIVGWLDNLSNEPIVSAAVR